jgi:tRNA(adenine34) deaminase
MYPALANRARKAAGTRKNEESFSRTLFMQHEKFMDLALGEAQKALEVGEFPVGCVLVHNDQVVARGRRCHSGMAAVSELDHAEIVALRSLAAKSFSFDLHGLVAYATMEPCLMCYAALLLNGVRTIVYGCEDAMGGGLGLDLTRLSPLYRDMTVVITGGVRRLESLRLFRRFFSDPDNKYWQGSLLAEYTMAQPLAEEGRDND